MKRRGFLGLLGLGSLGLAASSPVLDGFIKANKLKTAPSFLATPTCIVNEFAYSFRNALEGYATVYEPSVHSGWSVKAEIDAMDEWNELADIEQWREQVAQPCGRYLASEVRRLGIRRFLKPGDPGPGTDYAIVTSKDWGIAARLVRQYDIAKATTRMRFDIIGARA